MTPARTMGSQTSVDGDRKAAFRDVSVVEQGLPEHLVPVEGRGWDETVGKEASKAGDVACARRFWIPKSCVLLGRKSSEPQIANG